MNCDFSPNIYNISANFDFFESFSAWVLERFSQKAPLLSKNHLSELTILFPNQRACEEFRNIFAQKSSILPKIKAITDIALDDFVNFFPEEYVSEISSKINKIKTINKIDYLFFLSEQISSAEIFQNVDFSQSLSLALNFKGLFDDIRRHEIDSKALYKIDDSNLSSHRQFNLEFLRAFYQKIQAEMSRRGIFDEISRQDFIITQFSDALKNFSIKKSLIIAGSTASIDYSKKLIKEVSSQKNGHIVLHGLSNSRQEFDDEKDPQFFLNSLLKFIKITQKDVKEIIFPKFQKCNYKKIDFVEKSLIPSDKTHLLNEMVFDEKSLKTEFSTSLSYFCAQNEIDEARIVASQAQKAQNTAKAIAIIVNDHDFTKILKSQLLNSKTAFSDTHPSTMLDSKLVDFIMLLLSLTQNNFESVDLLSFLKHPYNIFSKSKVLSDFEIKILRAQRRGQGLDSIKFKSSIGTSEISQFFENFTKKLPNFSKKDNFGDFFTELLSSVEKFSNQNIQMLLEQEEAKDELSELFLKIQSYKKISVKSVDVLSLLQKLFANVFYFNKNESSQKIQIISSIEARLLSFDTVIIPCLNQGDFPQSEGDGWLGKKIRKDLGIDLSNKKYGQSAYDFCNYFSAKRVILTRSKTKNSSPTMPSPFILRLEILLKKIKLDFTKSQAKNPVKKKQQKQNLVEIPQKYHPDTLSVTDIATLIADPYQIYAKKILKLKPLDRIDYHPSHREFGSFVHAALEEFINHPQDNFLDSAHEIFAKFFINDDAKLIWWPKFTNILQNFLQKNQELRSSQDFVEISASKEFDGVTLRAKIDRISVSDSSGTTIFDYKTGQAPSKKDVFSGVQPQLALYALLLTQGQVEDGFGAQKIDNLSYWRLSSFGQSEIKIIAKDQEIEKLVNSAQEGLNKLFSYYKKAQNVYKISPNQSRKHDYSHLERIF